MRFKLTRAHYIPKGAIKQPHPATGAELHIYEGQGRFYGLAFSGKRQKPDWHYGFKTEEKRLEYVNKWLEGLRLSLLAKAERRREKTAYRHTLKPGDIVYNSWGYDQTNIDFYQVVEAPSGKTVRIRAIKGELQTDSDCGAMSGRTMPCKDAFIDDAPMLLKRVSKGNYLPFKHGCGSPWEGKPLYCSWYA